MNNGQSITSLTWVTCTSVVNLYRCSCTACTAGPMDASLASMGEGVPPTSTLEGTTGGTTTASGTSDLGVADDVATTPFTAEGAVPEHATPAASTPSASGPATPTAATAAEKVTVFTRDAATPAATATD